VSSKTIDAPAVFSPEKPATKQAPPPSGESDEKR
jgi:hypothetical protein